MKTIFNKNGYLEKLLIDGKNIICPWGIETSDSSGFFSLNENSIRENRISQKFSKTDNSINGIIESKLPFSHWEIKIKEKMDGNKIYRSQKLKCINNSQFNDFVSRFLFKKDFIENIEINNETYIYKDSRLKKEFFTNKVKINLKSGGYVLIKLKEYQCPTSMKPTIYIRDFRGNWIVHVRFLPYTPDIKQIKINQRWYDRAIPQWISDIILSINPIKKFLWYRGKRKKRFPISAVGLILCKPGDILSLETEFKYYSKSD